MFKKAVEDFSAFTRSYAQRIPYTNVYGLARSLLAFGTLSTLLFNGKDILFPTWYSGNLRPVTPADRLNLFYWFGYDNLLIAKIICCLILLWVISGYYPQITGILHFLVSFSFLRFALITDGGDQLTSILTFFLIPVTIIDKRINHWQRNAETYSPYADMFGNWALLFVKVQMSILYFQAATDKMQVAEWMSGTAVYYWFTHNVFGFPLWYRDFAAPLFLNGFVVSTVTWSVLILETFLFAAIFMSQNNRERLLVFALLFHFSIVLIHGLFSFFFAMAGGLILYLRSADREFDLPDFMKRKKKQNRQLQGFSNKAGKTMQTKDTPESEMFILYDEKCRFCTKFSNWVSKKNTAMNILPIRSPEAKTLLRNRGESFIDLQTVYFVQDSAIFKRSAAIFEIFFYLGQPWKLMSFLRYLPRGFTDYFYKLFAKYRYAFGRTEKA